MRHGITVAANASVKGKRRANSNLQFLRVHVLATMSIVLSGSANRATPLSYSAEPTQKEVAAWLKEEDPDDFVLRDAAEKKLKEAGGAAYTPLGMYSY